MLLLLKLCLVPGLVAAVTLAARRWGLRVGGILSALPMVAGPTLYFYAVEQGSAFAAAAARSAMLGIVANVAFCVAYARLAPHAPWPVGVLVGWAGFGVVAAVVYRLPELGGLGELALASGTLLAGRRLVPSPATPAGGARAPRWDLPFRMLASATLVVVLTAAAATLGSRLSGVLSAFPVVTLTLAVFTHAQRGAAAVTLFLRAMLRGLHGFAVFCFVFSLALGPLRMRSWAAAALALAAQAVVQGALLRQTSTGAPPAAAAPIGRREAARR